jgi:DnaJ like chaperone protein
MNATELLVIVGGLAIGYWVVSFFFGKRKAPAASPPSNEEMPPAANPPAAWHEVLEVSPAASTDDIRAAYRRLMGQYHPDKVSALGVELRALAERKSKEIGAAYREAMQLHGLAHEADA